MAYQSKTWIEYLEFYKKKFDENNIKINNIFNKSAVIVEPRITNLLELVIKNFMWFLHDEWNLIVFHGTENEVYIKDIIKNIGNVTLINLNVKNLTIDDYNNLLKSKKFYELTRSDYVLIFQIDTLLRKKIPNEYFNYSYVGAPWDSNMNWIKPIINTVGQVGNGGLSLRNTKDMIKIIDFMDSNFKPDMTNEDVYFSKGCQLLKLKKPSISLSLKFSIETIIYDDPIGMHKPRIDEEKLKKILGNYKLSDNNKKVSYIDLLLILIFFLIIIIIFN